MYRKDGGDVRLVEVVMGGVPDGLAKESRTKVKEPKKPMKRGRK